MSEGGQWSLDSGHIDQRIDARAASPAELRQTDRGDDAVLALQRHKIGDRAQACDPQEDTRIDRPLAGCREGERELESQAPPPTIP